MNDLCELETISENSSEYKETKTTYINFRKVGYISFHWETNQTALYNEQNYEIWYDKKPYTEERNFDLLKGKIKNASSEYIKTDPVSHNPVSTYIFNLDKIDYIYETVKEDNDGDETNDGYSYLYIRFPGSTAGISIDYNQKETILNEWNTFLNKETTQDITSCLN